MSAQDRKRRRYDDDVDQHRVHDDEKINDRYLTDDRRRRNERDMTLTLPAETATSRFLSFIGDDEDVAPQFIETHRHRYTRALPTPKVMTHSSSDDTRVMTTAPSSAPRTWRKLSVVTKNQQTSNDISWPQPHPAPQSTSASVSALDRAKQIALERERDVERTVSSADGDGDGDGGVNGHGDAAVSDLERLRQSLLQKRLSAKRAAILSPTANTANANTNTLTESKHVDSIMDTG